MTADTRNYSIEQDGKVTPYPKPPEVDDEGFITIYDSTAEERVKRIKAICEKCGYMQFVEAE